MHCPQCGQDNPSGARFCNQCGAGLTQGREAERRQLTVMFCDLADSTALSARFDPEVLRELLAAYQAAAGSAIARHDGHVAQYLGDGLLVYFGFPQAHEDAAARAVRAGLGILEALAALNANASDTRLPVLRARIGVHTGPVVVSEVGSGPRREQLALGETPNVAARLQALAEPGCVVISAATHRLVRDAFACRDLGQHALKGLPQPVHAWQVTHAAQAAPSATAIPPLVGRERERTLLAEHWRRALQGGGHGVLLQGEPGMGKTRLSRALREEALRVGGRVFEARCSHYHPGSPFHPIAEMIARAIDYEPERTEEAVEALESIIGGFAIAPRTVVPYLAGLLSLPLPERLALPVLSAQALRERTFEALLGLIGAIASAQPLLLVIEDLQWSDPSTLELVGRALERYPSARLLLLCTARSEFAPSPRLPFERLELGRCPDAVLEALVRSFAQADPLPDTVVAGIVARADGVPLFAEELARAVCETGSFEIPATLQDLLMARLDRLGTAKPVAQQAAVIGRRFSFGLLRAVTALEAGPLAEALEHAAQVGLVSGHGVPPEARYAFRHALFEDIAYQSMLRSTRQQMHRRVAEAILQVEPQTAETQPEVLAHHYTEAALLGEAVTYWLMAGRRALARSACIEAVAHVRRGLELVQSLPAESARLARELELQLVLAPALMAVRGAVANEVEQAYAQAGALCRQLGSTPKLLVPLWGLWAYALMRARYGEARALAAQLEQLAEQSRAPGPALVAAETLGMTLFYQGDFAAALAALRRGLALYRRPPEGQARQARGVHDPGVMCHAFEMLVLWLSGQSAAAIDSLARLHALDGVLEPYDRAFTRCAFAVLNQCQQDAAAVAAPAADALAISREQGFPTWAAMARVLQGWALAQQGRADEGVALARRGCAAWDATGAQNLRPYFRALLADANLAAGQGEAALGALDEALAAIEAGGERWWEAEVHRLRGEVLLALEPGRRDAAEESLQRALRAARAQGARAFEARAESSLARVAA